MNERTFNVYSFKIHRLDKYHWQIEFVDDLKKLKRVIHTSDELREVMSEWVDQHKFNIFGSEE